MLSGKGSNSSGPHDNGSLHILQGMRLGTNSSAFYAGKPALPCRFSLPVPSLLTRKSDLEEQHSYARQRIISLKSCVFCLAQEKERVDFSSTSNPTLKGTREQNRIWCFSKCIMQHSIDWSTEYIRSNLKHCREKSKQMKGISVYLSSDFVSPRACEHYEYSLICRP
jgi:hypothetical protein